jgi:putative transposase
MLEGRPLHAPPHPSAESGWFLITGATYEHQPLLPGDEDRRRLVDALMQELSQSAIQCSAWVVLPNHYHVLVRCEPLSLVAAPIGRTHGRTSREFNRRDGCAGRRVWYRYTGRRIRSEAHYFTTLNYIHYNPVKHGYVNTPPEWSATSVHWYLEHWGAEALDSLWQEYPLRSYGTGWDER